jgi:hypothetical protein
MRLKNKCYLGLSLHPTTSTEAGTQFGDCFLVKLQPSSNTEHTMKPKRIPGPCLANFIIPLALSISVAFAAVMAWVTVPRILAHGILGTLWDVIHLLLAVRKGASWQVDRMHQ